MSPAEAPFMSRASGGLGFTRIVGKCTTLLMAFALIATSAAHVSDTSQIDAYLKAITQPDITGRLSALERFVAGAPGSSLKVDALEWIVWDERQTHNEAAAANWAQELLKSDPDNALGLAIPLPSQTHSPRSKDDHHKSDARVSPYEQSVNRGLENLPRLRRPEGMSHDEFSRLRLQVAGLLNAAAGSAALERKDYPRARLLLGEAVKASPNDPRLVYALALADLSGEKPDRQQGYWLLARAVNLSGGASAARDVEEFGRKKYKDDGGNDRDWEQYLAVTKAPGANAATMIATATAPEAQSPASKPSARPVPDTPAAAKQSKSKDKTAAAKNRTPARASKSGWNGEAEPPAESTAAANSLPPISGAANQAVRTGAPVSLGLLVETSMARKGTRSAIVHSLTDLVRRLGPQDEAFILSFSNDLVFEEDLTGDAGRLEHALDQIKPNPGTALLDAAGFAAGHLRRIAKNDSRILLVISDGKNANSRIPALASSNEIRASGVTIYCIGVDVAATEGIQRLQGLASATGGTAAFVTAPDQFRAAAQQLALHMGIRFDY